jgi:GT2 family glycosyltransferase
VEQATPTGARTVSGVPIAEALVAGGALDINGLVLTRAVFARIGGFDESQRRWVHLDLVLRLLPVARCAAVADVGARGVPVDDGAPRLDRSESDHWFWVAVGRHVVDWDAVDAGLADRDADLVSIVMPTYEDWRMTVAAVASVLSASDGHRLEILVVDNGSERSVTSILEARFVSRPEVRILRQKRNLNFAIGCNVGMAASNGSRIVFLNNDTDVMPGWLDPLLDGLDDRGVRGTQPLLLYPDGTIQSAGSLLPGGDSPPIALLAGYPPEDARRVESLDLRVVTAAAVAVRADEFAALRGYDPMFVNGQEDVDYCLRAVDRFGGVFRVVTGATVIHHESKTPGRGARIQANRRILVDRWRGRLAADDTAAMAGTGLTITRWNPPGAPRDLDDVRIPTPVVERIAPVSVQESLPSLRWAITIAAHPGPRGDVWGDTHFAAALTTSLERLGQQVVVDRREAYNRPTSGIDDVQLVLRGLEEVPVSPGRVNLLWVISHPDLVTERELVSYQRVFAASASWAGRCTASGHPVLPLLQATDPALFHPGKHDETEHDAVVFVGRSRNILRPVIRDAVEAGVSPVIFGDGWEAFDLGHLVRAPYLEPDDVAVLYASAGVVLNDHWADMARDGFLSNRLFDAVASGARVVTDEVDADLSLFGGAVQAYRDVADLGVLCSPAGRDRFPDDAARREIAGRMAREHSFDARAHQLVEAALRVRAEQGWAPRG